MGCKEDIIKQIESMDEEELRQSIIEYPNEEDFDIENNDIPELEIDKENRRKENEDLFASMIASFEVDNEDIILKGYNYGLYYSGMYQALIQAGMTTEQAYQIVLNESTIRGNLKIAKTNSDNGNTNLIGFQEINPYDNLEGEEEYDFKFRTVKK